MLIIKVDAYLVNWQRQVRSNPTLGRSLTKDDIQRYELMVQRQNQSSSAIPQNDDFAPSYVSNERRRRSELPFDVENNSNNGYLDRSRQHSQHQHTGTDFDTASEIVTESRLLTQNSVNRYYSDNVNHNNVNNNNMSRHSNANNNYDNSYNNKNRNNMNRQGYNNNNSNSNAQHRPMSALNPLEASLAGESLLLYLPGNNNNNNNNIGITNHFVNNADTMSLNSSLNNSANSRNNGIANNNNNNNINNGYQSLESSSNSQYSIPMQSVQIEKLNMSNTTNTNNMNLSISARKNYDDRLAMNNSYKEQPVSSVTNTNTTTTANNINNNSMISPSKNNRPMSASNRPMSASNLLNTSNRPLSSSNKPPPTSTSTSTTTNSNTSSMSHRPSSSSNIRPMSSGGRPMSASTNNNNNSNNKMAVSELESKAKIVSVLVM